MMPPVTIIGALDEIAGRYDVLYCDLWGCLHDGRRVFPEATRALTGFREGGGTVILVTNSPRPRAEVARQLDVLQAPRESYDDIASSGDAAQAAMADGQFGRKVFHLGPERDLPFFSDEAGRPFDIERVDLDAAEGIVCTGLFDDRTETPEDYRLTLMRAKSRGLKMLCANPDIQVDMGDQRIFCAGALARFYEEMGGAAFYFGKPHPPIYDIARRRAEAARGAAVADGAILCVGDGIATDIQGGMSEGLDTLFVTGGLAAEETGTIGGDPDPDRTAAYLAKAMLSPTAVIGRLR
jgi:HAD superfamily hydrolase (TIGR01459 family)